MSAGNDITYRLKASNMTRTSDDFIPDVPKSHGVHIFKNAVNSLFTRDITYADWDMFMTKHEFGAYHAAARAISGGPVYVTDKEQKIVSGEFVLGDKGFDIFTKPDMKDGFGVFGLTRFYNMGGTVKEFRIIDGFAYIELFDTGEFAAYCNTKPSAVVCGSKPSEISYDNGVVKFFSDSTDIIIKK